MLLPLAGFVAVTALGCDPGTAGTDAGPRSDGGGPPGEVDASEPPGADCILAFEEDASSLSVWGIDGTDHGVIYAGDGSREPEVSPDGERFAMLSGPTTVVLFERDGSGRMELPLESQAHAPARLAWSPDQTRIAVSTDAGVEIHATDGSGLVGVVEATTEAGSPDGQFGTARSGFSRGMAWFGDEIVYPCRDRVGDTWDSRDSHLCRAPVGGGPATLFWGEGRMAQSVNIYDSDPIAEVLLVHIVITVPNEDVVMDTRGTTRTRLELSGVAFDAAGDRIITTGGSDVDLRWGTMSTATGAFTPFADELGFPTGYVMEPVAWGLRCP